MRRFTANVGSALALGLGLALTLVWALSRQTIPVIAAPTLRQAERPLSDATPTHYVTITGTDSSNCSTPEGACLTIQYAVDQAGEGDVIKVATGTYAGVSAHAAPPEYPGPSVVTQVVYISKTVTIQGGYTTTNWTTPHPITQPTTIDVQGQGRGILITGDISPTIEGLRITGGNATGQGGQPDPHVGYSRAGGGLLLACSGKATLTRNVFISNTSPGGYGGGLGLSVSHNAILSGNIFISNTAYAGGGLSLYCSHNVVISGNTIMSNTASGGGGVYLYVSSNATLSDNTIRSNNATGSCGGLSLNMFSDNSTLSSNTIISNTANFGGGVCLIQNLNVTLSENTIAFNIANIRGGGLSLSSGYNVIITNTVIANNQAGSEGSGVHVQNSSLRMLHTTIARNSDGDGSGIYVTGAFGGHSTIALTNTVLVSHTVGITVTDDNTATLEATLWGSGNWTNDSDWGGAGTIITGTHNYWGDPAFVDPDTGDYHITVGSAAINKGVNAGVTNDIDDDLRVDTPDIGADEWKGMQVYLPLALRDLH